MHDLPVCMQCLTLHALAVRLHAYAFGVHVFECVRARCEEVETAYSGHRYWEPLKAIIEVNVKGVDRNVQLRGSELHVRDHVFIRCKSRNFCGMVVNPEELEAGEAVAGIRNSREETASLSMANPCSSWTSKGDEKLNNEKVNTGRPGMKHYVIPNVRLVCDHPRSNNYKTFLYVSYMHRYIHTKLRTCSFAGSIFVQSRTSRPWSNLGMVYARSCNVSSLLSIY